MTARKMQSRTITRQDAGFIVFTGRILVVPMEGVEPTHPYGYQILSLARLPIPPHRLPGEGERY